MPPNPKVSVIVPAYNAERYLAECLDSIAGQELADLEVLCVNDGSTDSTLGIMREYEAHDPRFRVIDKSNTGYGDSMNVAMDQACGTWVASVDSDDLVPPQAYARMVAAAEDGNLDFVKADRTSFSGDARLGDGRRNPISRSESAYGGVLDPSSGPWRCGVKPGQPGLYRADFLREHRIRHNDSPGASFQDTGFWAQVVFHARRAMLLREELYLVRRDNPGSSTLDTSKVFVLCDEHDFIRRKALEMPPESRALCLRSAAAMRLEGYRWNERRLLPGDREPFVARAHSEFAKLEVLGELDQEVFSEGEWDRLRLLIDRPMEYYARFCHDDPRVPEMWERLARERERARRGEAALRESEARLAEARARLAQLKQSSSWRAGRVVTWLPRKVKRRMRRTGRMG